MEEEPELPSGVCRDCLEAAVSVVRFRQLCKTSECEWKRTINSLSDLETPDTYDKIFYIFIGDEKATVIREQSHKADKTAEKDEVSGNIKKRVEYLNLKNKRCSSGKKCKCPDCGKGFLSVDYLNIHLKKSSKRACIFCGDVMSRSSYPEHMTKVHQRTVKICDICPMQLEGSDVDSHFAEFHPANNFSCAVCKRGFSNQRALNAHMYAHSLFHCSTCNRSFENRKCLRFHSKQCSKQSLAKMSDRFTYYMCDHCGGVYDKKPSLRIHITQKHLNVLPFVCPDCGKRTSTLAHLRSHQKTHKKVRELFTCHCGSQFKTELGFQLHRRIHTGERPYKCEECGDRFLSASRRLDHIKRKHRSTKDMAHGCTECPARFVRPFELKKHYLSAHFAIVEVEPVKKRPRRIMWMLEDQYLPSGACVACTTAILSAHEFKTFVKNSEHIWKTSIDNLLKLPDNFKYPMKSLYAIIYKETMDIKVLYDRARGEPKNIVNNLTGPTSNRLKKKDFNAVKEKKVKITKNGPYCICTDCGQKFSSPYLLNQHLKNSGQKEACLSCGAIVIRGKDMQAHMLKVHGESMVLCKECPLLFNGEKDLELHVKTAHGPGALTCGDCGRTFPRSGTIEAHSQMHAVRTCRTCGKQFTNRGCYRRHRSQCEPDAKPDKQNIPRNRRKNIRDPAKFICDYCNKEYRSRPQLKNHIIWIHMNVRPHKCEWCQKRFYTPARLNEHKVVHTRERKFECDICGLKLVSKMAAVYHRRRHTGERPYKCEDCNECFISSSRRSEHAKRRHNKGHMFACSQCPITFVRSHALRKHVEKIHNTGPMFACSQCPITFVTSQALRKHVEKVHNTKRWKWNSP